MKKYLITGLLIWIPLVITIWVLKLGVDALDKVLLFVPKDWRPESTFGFHIYGLGVVITVAIVLVTGVFASRSGTTCCTRSRSCARSTRA
jgi:uncharacterized membrane protein